MELSKLLYNQIEKKSLMRLKNEKRDQDERLQDPQDPFFFKPQEYAMAIYSYYMCFSCNKPYFGGLKSCENIALQANQK